MTSRMLAAALIAVTAAGCGSDGREEPDMSSLPPLLPRSYDFHIFYYAWYGTPAVDGRWHHWNHEVLSPDGGGSGSAYPGGDDIGSAFFPDGGPYSSNDPAVLDRHMKQIRLAGAGVVCVSWWGEGSFSDRAVPGLLEAAARHGLKVSFHIEPFEGRGAPSTRRAVEYIVDEYGAHKAFYRTDRFGRRPMFFVYDSYLTPPAEWATVLSPSGPATLRGTTYDSIVIGLWVNEGDGDSIAAAGFDGFYTYFAVDGFTHGSTPDNWTAMSLWAWERDLLFVPCIGPGYDDTRIRPWNAANRRERERGEYMARMFRKAYAASTPFLGITSFNEWHEGTQIEPAVPKSIDGYAYRDYSPLPLDYYLHWTRSFLMNYKYTFSK
ncbi:MAG: glycoside hydrolase family 99 protein [Candidatus Krumholzibacteria bacterium]|nr:glycoside hydrolase family 99 protein [Candidatus Krumholzibacteria bacterium]